MSLARRAKKPTGPFYAYEFNGGAVWLRLNVDLLTFSFDNLSRQNFELRSAAPFSLSLSLSLSR